MSQCVHLFIGIAVLEKIPNTYGVSVVLLSVLSYGTSAMAGKFTQLDARVEYLLNNGESST